MALSDLQKEELERLVLNKNEATRRKNELNKEIELLTETILNVGGLTLEEIQSIWGLTEEAAQKLLDKLTDTNGRT